MVRTYKPRPYRCADCPPGERLHEHSGPGRLPKKCPEHSNGTRGFRVSVDGKHVKYTDRTQPRPPRMFVCVDCPEGTLHEHPHRGGRLPTRCAEHRAKTGDRLYKCRACPTDHPGYWQKGTGRLHVLCPKHRGVPNGAVIYEGPSALNGEPIVVVVSGIRNGSSNPKIGKMAQVWILPLNMQPKDSFHDKTQSEAVCGDCVPKWVDGGACYVHWRWGPQMIWYAHTEMKSYQPLKIEWLRNRMIRFGAYGDPAAVPLDVWKPILKVAKGWTGYTHQWRNLNVIDWGWLMASVDRGRERLSANRRGWRTFRVRKQGAPKLDREVVCPAAPESSNEGVSCATCGLCNGHGRNGRGRKVRDIVIEVHGTRKSMGVFK